MGEISYNLHELMSLPGFILFNEDVLNKYVFSDDVKRKVVNHFFNREIAYDTPQYFQLKFNNKLDILSDNYNKMLQSQLVELDPFITEYMETNDTSHRDLKTEQSEDTTIKHTSGRTTDTSYSANGTETYTRLGTEGHQKDNTGVMVNGKLSSEASNEDVDENSSRDLSRNVSIDYTEDKEDNKTTDTVTTETNKGTDNQTARNWTENGSSQAHNLDVHSDTPQAMLFNEPNHYYGTGRAHDYGEVKTDEQGNEYYQHYPETEPNSIDANSYQIGGGDTPWFNYASAADNKTGHDSYNKAGTETYGKNSTEDKSKTVSETTEETVNTEGHKTEETSESEDKTLKRETGFAKNVSENTKQDDKQQETYKGDTSENLDRGTTNKAFTGVKSDLHEGSNNKVDGNSTEHEHTGSVQFRKGRSGKSPSELLKDYRETLQFNADLWLFSQLEPLFLGLF